MKRDAKELYNKIVEAKIGEIVGLTYKGKNYEYTITDALTQQGYKKGIDFDLTFNYAICKNFIKKLSDIKEYQEPQHNIKKGDIFYHSWGWEQTNIDYYQVVKTTKKTITLKEIEKSIESYNDMRGSVIPLEGNFKNDEELRKTPYLLDSNWYVKFDYGIGKKWEGEAMRFTSYA